MNDPDGRYANSARLQITGADGRVATYLARRFLPDPESLPVAARARIEPGDRLDLFAARTMGAAPHWWRIADAHRVVHRLRGDERPPAAHPLLGPCAQRGVGVDALFDGLGILGGRRLRLVLILTRQQHAPEHPHEGLAAIAGVSDCSARPPPLASEHSGELAVHCVLDARGGVWAGHIYDGSPCARPGRRLTDQV